MPPITKEDVMTQHGYKDTAGEVVKKEVRFAVFAVGNGELRYHAIHADYGDVNRKPLTQVYSRGNYTLARTESGTEVMVDDEGLHRDWGE